MYVARNHTSTVTTQSVLPFTCVNCGHRAEAVVLGVGQGSGQSPFFLDESGAKERARSEAQEAARDNAVLTLSLARCPSCQRTNERALTSLKMKAAAAVVATLVAFPLLGLLIDALKGTNFGIWIFVVLAPVCAFVVGRAQSMKWQNVDARVLFVDS